MFLIINHYGFFSIRILATSMYAGNEYFFLNFDNINLENIGFTSDHLILISKVKNIWLSSNINDKQKAYIWLYLQKLIQAGEKVI